MEVRKKTVYPAHPVRGDVAGNVRRLKDIVRALHLQGEVQPVAPHIADCDGILNDHDMFERAIGIAAATEYFRRGMIDEVWLYGPRISDGMRQEILLAWDLRIPVVAMSALTDIELAAMEHLERPRDAGIHDVIVRYMRRMQPVDYDTLKRWLWKHEPTRAQYLAVAITERKIIYLNSGLLGVPD